MKKGFLKWSDDLVIEFAKQVVINMSSNTYSRSSMREKLEIFKTSNGVHLKELEFFERKDNLAFMKKYSDFVEKNYNYLTIKDITLLNNFIVFLEHNNLLQHENSNKIRPGFGPGEDRVRL
jgi:hypothetical protein